MRATTRIVIFKLEDSNQSRAQAIVLHKTEGHIPRWPGDNASRGVQAGTKDSRRLDGYTRPHPRPYGHKSPSVVLLTIEKSSQLLK